MKNNRVKNLAREKWRNYASRCRKKEIGYLTYEQYIEKLKEAGITANQVGRTTGSYQLARYTDTGDYTPESCRFILLHENLAEMRTNGGRESMREKLSSRNKLNDEGIARRAEAIRGRTMETHPYLAAKKKVTGEALRGRTKETHSGVARTAEKNACEYSFIAPDGVVHSGRNISEFCKKHGLLRASMSNIRRSHIKRHKGWMLAPKSVGAT